MNAELPDQTDMGRNAMWQMRYHVERPPRACDRIGDTSAQSGLLLNHLIWVASRTSAHQLLRGMDLATKGS